MKKIAVAMFICLIGIVILVSPQSFAQTNVSSKPTVPNQEQVMKDLLTEVRQLRQEVRRMATSAYRAQTLIERVRVQQEQVNRLALELGRVQSQISELRSKRGELQARILAMEKRFEAGLLPESEINADKSALESLNQRESELMDRESRLTIELAAERAALALLNRRLDEVEQELQSIGSDDKGEGIKKEQ